MTQAIHSLAYHLLRFFIAFILPSPADETFIVCWQILVELVLHLSLTMLVIRLAEEAALGQLPRV